MKNYIKFFGNGWRNCFIISLFFLPEISFAMPANLSGFIALFLDLLKISIPIMTGVAFLLFFFGIAKVIFSSQDSKERGNSKQFILYAILAMFVLLSLGGLLQFLSNQFEFGTIKKPFLPQ